jgi:hypothetical protein
LWILKVLQTLRIKGLIKGLSLVQRRAANNLKVKKLKIISNKYFFSLKSNGLDNARSGVWGGRDIYGNCYTADGTCIPCQENHYFVCAKPRNEKSTYTFLKQKYLF